MVNRSILVVSMREGKLGTEHGISWKMELTPSWGRQLASVASQASERVSPHGTCQISAIILTPENRRIYMCTMSGKLAIPPI